MNVPWPARHALGLADGSLLGAVRGGDEDAFAALFDRHAQTVYRFCWLRCRLKEDAEDALSLVFLEAWRCRARLLLVDDSLLPWLLGIAGNVLRSRRRTEHRHARALERLRAGGHDPESQDHADEVAERLDAPARVRSAWLALAALPPKTRDVAHLCLIEGLTTAQASAALRIPENTAKSRLARARARLRVLLQSGEEGDLAALPRHDMSERGHRAPADVEASWTS